MVGENKFKLKELNINPLEKIFRNECVPIVFSSSNYFVPYLSVAIQSIIENSDLSCNYDIVVLNKDINEDNREILISILDGRKNFSLRFVDISSVIKNMPLKINYTSHVSIETYFRFLAMEIMKNYDKILYLDSDLVVVDNIKKLYDIDIKDKLLGATYESLLIPHIKLYNAEKYYYDTLKMKSIDSYFQAGVLVVKSKEFSKRKYPLKLINMCLNFNYNILDQDALNELFIEDYYLISKEWNYTPLQKHMIKSNYLTNMLDKIRNDYLSVKSPKIIHYADYEKPWLDPEEKMANVWWKYARKSPFYELILYRMGIHDMNLKTKTDTTTHLYTIKTIVKRFKLFNLIPLLKIKKKNDKTRYYLFGLIPFLRVKKKDNKTRYYLFDIIPLLKTTIK